MYNETRFTMLVHSRPEIAEELLEEAEEEIRLRWRVYEALAQMPVNGRNGRA
jgi:pyruvate-ferredoxin/flavodoxin oxidoreductase